MTSNFYRDFEDRYRGSRELIKRRQMVYVPFIAPLKEIYETCNAIDLGCGRGEWLEILIEQGFSPVGVDLDEGMLEACEALDLPTQHADALAGLRALESESQVVVSGFHIAEHIPFSDLQTLVIESLRVLKPGGLLILETPNAENLVVGTNNFYLDPTHERPIPHLLLAFLTEHSGFARSKLLRLQESPELLDADKVSLLQVLAGTSPDYAIIAQKNTDAFSEKFDSAFAGDHGVALDDLATRYQNGLTSHFAELDGRSQQLAGALKKSGLEVELIKLDMDAVKHDAAEQTERVGGLITEAKTDLADQLRQWADVLAETKQALKAVSFNHDQAVAYATALERRVSELEIRADLTEAAIGGMQKQTPMSLKSLIKRAIKPVVSKAMSAILANPSFRKHTNSVIRKFPSVHRKLKQFAKNRGIIPGGRASESYSPRPEIHETAYTYINPSVMPTQPDVPEGAFLEAKSNDSSFSWVRFTGHIEGHYSLAVVNRGLAVALSSQLDGRLKFVPYHGKRYENPTDIPASQSSLLNAVDVQIVEEENEKILSIVHHYPMIFDGEQSGLRVVFFFWEETVIPNETIAHLNEHFDLVIAATSFVKKSLQDSGCSIAVTVCPIGIDHLIPESMEPIGALKPAEGAPFRFLHISSMFERKGPDVLISAYLDEFSANDNVELYIKTFPNPHNRVHDLIADISAGRDHLPRIIVDEEHMNDQQLIELYRSSHTMVLPTRGEGFNLPAAEALAMALPVIVTGYGAHVDFCTRSTASLIPFQFAKSESHLRCADSCWVEPDRASLALQMRENYRQVLNHDAELEIRRQDGLRHVRSTYTWEKSARAVLASAAWAKANKDSQRNEKTRLAVISPWATRCGVAEYTQSLLSNFDDSNFDISIFCDLRTEPNSTQTRYQPVWALGDTDAVKEALGHPDCLDSDVLLIQHQPSLFRLDDELCEKLANLQDAGIVVVLELHSTLPLIAEHRISESGVQALRKLDRIIVHKPEDLNNLLILGLVANVMMIGLGVIQPLPEGSAEEVRPELGIGEGDLVIACFGFILPHKGIDTLIETVLPLAAASGRRIHMLGLHSILDVRSEQTLNAYQARAQELGVNTNITWLTDYLPINECLRLMSAADYVIFPYKETYESASAAVTIGLATLKPVLVSPIHIFSDLSEVTWRMNGSRADDIVGAIMELEAKPQLKSELVERQKNWTTERSWNRISSRLDHMIQSLLMDKQLNLAITPYRRDTLDIRASTGTRKLFVDVSELYFRDAKTGIQRVVKNVINQLQRSEDSRYLVVPVFGASGHGYRYASNYPNTSQYVASQNEQPITFSPGDIFLGLDLSAHLFPEFDLELDRMKRANVKIYFVVYDLIPLLHPRFAYPGIDTAFVNWIRSLGRYADGLIGISNAVATDVREWLMKREGMRVMPYVDYFHLGADIEDRESAPQADGKHEELIDALKQRPSFLMVGTLEPRKGHAQTLAAFEYLWRNDVDVNLVIVGKEGWAVDRLARRLRRHPLLAKRLFWLEGINDSTLTRVYETCSCLVASSEAEGFGLPLIEAAQYGLPIIARDIPVFREVAGDHAFYFEGMDPEALGKAIQDWLLLYQNQTHPSAQAMPWMSWEESVNMLKNIILADK
jgi:glycosyltransferase involved in cell wall biosynthesis/SAM-dependent methyltransferase